MSVGVSARTFLRPLAAGDRGELERVPRSVNVFKDYEIPIALEVAGVFSRTWEIKNSSLISHAGALELDGAPTLILLIGASIATIVIAGIHAARIYRSGREANRQLVMQSWHLRQLLPTTSG